MDLSLVNSLICLAFSFLATVGAGVLGARPPSPKGPRLMPWRFIMLLLATFCILLLVHIVTLLGLKHDQSF